MKVRDVPEINTDDPEELEIYKVVTKYLWQAFDIGAPDTPQRITRVVLHALRSNGFTVKKTGGQ